MRRPRGGAALLEGFLERLRGFTALDPTRGSGNFLSLALHALKDPERRVQLEAEALGLDYVSPAVGPANAGYRAHGTAAL